MLKNPLVAIFAFCALALYACGNSEPTASAAPVTRQHTTGPIVGQFKYRIFPITEREHVTMFDVPGYWEPTRCWAWVDTQTNTSHMRCDSDGDKPLPEQGPALEN